MTGRKPKPQEKKELQGTARADRTNENRMEPMKILSVPEPPDYLGEHGRELWKEQLQQLAHLKMLTKVDLTILGQYCSYFDQFMGATEYLNEDERNWRNKHDQVDPAVSVRDKAFDRMIKVADRFGFAATAREKLSMPEQGSGDPLEEHLNKKTG